MATVTELHADLISASFVYAGDELSPEFKRRACAQIRELSQPVVVTLEDSAEKCGQFLVATMANLHAETAGPKEASDALKALLSQLDGMALKDLQVGCFKL